MNNLNLCKIKKTNPSLLRATSYRTKNLFFSNHETFSIKLNYCSPYFWRKSFMFSASFVFKYGDKNIYSRYSAIPYSFLGIPVRIHSGKKWFVRKVNIWNVGFKFGELTWNRKMALYKAKQLRKKKKSKK